MRFPKTNEPPHEISNNLLEISSRGSFVFLLQCGILTSVDSDEPVQPPFKVRDSK